MPVNIETIRQDDLVIRFREFINKKSLVKKNDHVLLAISGGIDSVAMAYLFASLKLHFGIAHCNFQLRGKDSNQDEKSVARLARTLRVEFHSKRFATAKYAMENKISIQMAARDLRYEWFEDLRKKHKYNLIATAHHKDDQLETILLNLTRGTGIQGLTGISEKRKKIIRPVLFAAKKELLEFAKRNGLKWREDRTNEEVKYYRNKIRKKVIPVLKEINPSLEEGVLRTIEKIKTASWVYENFLKTFKSKVIKKRDKSFYISKKEISSQGIYSKILLFEAVRDFEFNIDQAESIIKGWNRPGRIFYSNHWELVNDRQYLVISRRRKTAEIRINIYPEDKMVILPVGSLIFEEVKRPKELKTGKHTILTDLAKVNYPLVLRNWNAGDKFQPIGMKGKKKLSDFMIDEKIPVNLKKRALILESKEGIIWVVGMRPDDRFKVTPGSKRILKIIYNSDD